MQVQNASSCAIQQQQADLMIPRFMVRL